MADWEHVTVLGFFRFVDAAAILLQYFSQVQSFALANSYAGSSYFGLLKSYCVLLVDMKKAGHWNLSVNFLTAISDDSVPLEIIKSENGKDEYIGTAFFSRNVRGANRGTLFGVRSQDFFMKIVITTWNVAFVVVVVLHVHCLKWLNFTASSRICMRPKYFMKQNITTTWSCTWLPLCCALCFCRKRHVLHWLWKWRVFLCQVAFS